MFIWQQTAFHVQGGLIALLPIFKSFSTLSKDLMVIRAMGILVIFSMHSNNSRIQRNQQHSIQTFSRDKEGVTLCHDNGIRKDMAMKSKMLWQRQRAFERCHKCQSLNQSRHIHKRLNGSTLPNCGFRWEIVYHWDGIQFQSYRLLFTNPEDTQTQSRQHLVHSDSRVCDDLGRRDREQSDHTTQCVPTAKTSWRICSLTNEQSQGSRCSIKDSFN